MSRTIPTIKETAQALEARVHKEKNPKLKIRVHMLALLRGGKTETMQQVSDQLGVHRNTVGRWLRSYEVGGIDKLLEIKSTGPRGGQRTIDEEALEALKGRLAQSRGFSGYRGIQLWLREHYGLDINYVTLHQIVRYRLGAKLKVARKSHIKKS